MRTNVMRGACAALLMSVAPAAAGAATPESRAYPAIATGLAIPVGPPAALDSEVPARGRFVLVDAASARLFMIEDGQVVDSMRVIVGKPTAATPTLRSAIYHATLNPYWNVPPDLARTIIAPKVLAQGPDYLKEKGYQVVSSFRGDAEVLDARSVDWQAVAEGRAKVYVRQLPGPGNSMGLVKLGFPNSDGIYLHDTPKKELFAEEQRNVSNGCVRLEDAPRLARWLLGREPVARSAEPEQRIALPRPVPIVITYLDERAQMQLASAR